MLLGWAQFYRPNFFANTPDILHEYLQHGGRPAFEARLVLAATLSPSYGIYSGYEHFENVPVREGSEEYLDSEKYEVKQRDARRPAAAARAAAERDPPRRAGAAAVREPAPARDARRARLRVREGTRRSRSRSTSTRATRGRTSSSCPPDLGLPEEFPVRDLLERRALPLADRPQLRRPRPGPVAPDEDRRMNGAAARPPRTVARTVRVCDERAAERRPHECETASSRKRQTAARERARPLVRVEPAVVQDGRLLRDPHAGVLRRQRRRLGRLPRPAAEARLPAVARHRLHLAAPVLPLAAPRRRLRHRRLLRHQPRLRHGRGLPRLRRGGARARDAGDRRPRHEPHLLRPPLVPGVALRPGRPEARLVRLVGHATSAYRDARIIFIDTEASNWTYDPVARPVLLAPLLQPPAGPQLREPRGAGRDARGAPLLARPRARRLPARRRAVPVRARGHELREPAAHARVPEARARGGRRALPRPRAARRGEPVAGGRRRLLRRRATSATWPSTSR